MRAVNSPINNMLINNTPNNELVDCDNLSDGLFSKVFDKAHYLWHCWSNGVFN